MGFSNLYSMASAAYQFVSRTLDNFAGYFASPLPKSFGLEIGRIRPFLSRIYTVRPAPELQPKQHEHLLKTVMSLKEPDARMIHKVINEVTTSSFFLSMNNDKAKDLRRELVHAINTNMDEVSQETDLVLMQLIDYLKTKPQVTAEVNTQITHAIRELVIHTLTGLKLSPGVHAAIDKLENMQATSFGFNPFIPDALRFFSRSVSERKNEFDQAVSEFLRDEIIRICTTTPKKNNLLLNIIRKRYPEMNVSEIPRNENILQSLVVDPDIRLNITGSLAARNLSKVIISGLTYLFNNTMIAQDGTTSRTMLLRELQRYKNIGGRFLMGQMTNPQNLPFLHAFWLETLRCAPPMLWIDRYTEKGFEVDGMKIPEQSLVTVPITAHCQLENDVLSKNMFQPLRFYPLKHQLHTGFFTPFGLGPRMCPGHQLAEVVFKKFIAAFALNFSNYCSEKIEFIPDENEALNHTPFLVPSFLLPEKSPYRLG